MTHAHAEGGGVGTGTNGAQGVATAEGEAGGILVVDAAVHSVSLGTLGEVVAVTQGPLVGIGVVVSQITGGLVSLLVGNGELVSTHDVLGAQVVGVALHVQASSAGINGTLEVLVHTNQGGALTEVVGGSQQVGAVIFTSHTTNTNVVQLQVGVSTLEAAVSVVQSQVPATGINAVAVGGGVDGLGGDIILARPYIISWNLKIINAFRLY